MIDEFFYIRHGQTDWNKKNVFQGHNDIPLNQTGKEQARVLSSKLVLADDAIIFSSPLKRAKETAQIATSLTNNIVIMPEFMECNSPEGAKYLLSLKGETKLPCFKNLNQNGESPEELLLRVRVGLNKMKELSDGKTAYLFSHGGIGTAICKLLEINYFKTPNCGMFKFQNSNGRFTATKIH
ncbi:histidine phosphatase family protein [Bacteriovoracaceae bacterium]|nr:histidine phosphatase family protein [Bacteriovoracaceae bacterium]